MSWIRWRTRSTRTRTGWRACHSGLNFVSVCQRKEDFGAALFRGETQVEVAKEVGISQAQVSRLEKGAIEQIKKNLS